jgi:hypothetical protein
MTFRGVERWTQLDYFCSTEHMEVHEVALPTDPVLRIRKLQAH